MTAVMTGEMEAASNSKGSTLSIHNQLKQDVYVTTGAASQVSIKSGATVEVPFISTSSPIQDNGPISISSSNSSNATPLIATSLKIDGSYLVRNNNGKVSPVLTVCSPIVLQVVGSNGVTMNVTSASR